MDICAYGTVACATAVNGAGENIHKQFAIKVEESGFLTFTGTRQSKLKV